MRTILALGIALYLTIVALFALDAITIMRDVAAR